jgi:hypothetical protein
MTSSLLLNTPPLKKKLSKANVDLWKTKYSFAGRRGELKDNLILKYFIINFHRKVRILIM